MRATARFQGRPPCPDGRVPRGIQSRDDELAGVTTVLTRGFVPRARFNPLISQRGGSFRLPGWLSEPAERLAIVLTARHRRVPAVPASIGVHGRNKATSL